MSKLLKALLEKTGIAWFFRGVSVELPAYFLPNFQVVEISNAKHAIRNRTSSAGYQTAEHR
jgi:hypothetical protein